MATTLSFGFGRSAQRIFTGFLLACAFMVTVSATAVAQEETAQVSVLDKVRDRGFLICGASNALPGFAQRNDEGIWVGFDVDFCRAIAAATLGDPSLVEFRSLSGIARFSQLQSGEIDVLVRNGDWTISRDLQNGVEYVSTSFFDGMSFLVHQDRGFISAFMMEDVSICVSGHGDDLRATRTFVFENQITAREVLYEEPADLGPAFEAGLCDVVAAPISKLQAIRRSLPDPGQHRIMPELISKAPMGPTIAQGDAQWRDIIRWTLFAMINAEELGVNAANVETMLASSTPAIRRLLGLEGQFGEALGLSQDWADRVIGSVGNYGEVFDRHFGPQTGASLSRGLNSLWTQGGLFYAPPIR